MKTWHIIFLTVGSVALLGVVGGLIAWGVVASNNCLFKGTTTSFSAAHPDLDWWQHCVMYEIYPLSFKDSDGDGIGDLAGIIDHLNHFKDAGVDAILMTPFFVSSMVDHGYDIIDFYEIHSTYGNMEVFEDLLSTAHEIGIKVLLDLVPNHASTSSEYFNKSEEGDPQFKDFFVWADGITDPDDPKQKLPPSNWRSQFGGSAWEWSEKRRQYYLHQFTVAQADFNLRNPAVKQEMLNIMQFWLDKGVDGFRITSSPFLLEANPADHGGRYPDNPKPTVPLYNMNLIEVYDIVYEYRNFIDKYNKEHEGHTRVIFSEGYVANITMTMLYYGNKQGALGVHFPFNFDFISELSDKSNARDFVYTILKWLTYMPHGAVANWLFGDHDNHRMPDRFRDDMVDGLNSLNMMLPGTSVTYQGEEIGMRDGYISPEESHDVIGRNSRKLGNEVTYFLRNRDSGRTPYHWDNSSNAGFSTSEKTWLPVAEDYKEINLAKQKADEKSHFKVYQALTALRKEKTLSHGDYNIRALTDNTFYVVRSLRGYDTLVFLFNVGEVPDTIVLNWVPHLKTPATVYISSIHSSRDTGNIIDDESLTLVPGEALILRA